MGEKVEIKSIKLSNGIEFPMVGLGTFRVDFIDLTTLKI